jgi:hypothetical protein
MVPGKLGDPYDLARARIARLVTLYKRAGTAKRSASYPRLHELWMGCGLKMASP